MYTYSALLTDLGNFKSYHRINKLLKCIFIGLKSLETLFLDGNRIEVLEDGCWKDLSNLKVLVLGGIFPTLHENMFSHLSKLESLDLRSCQISTILPGAFGGLERLEELKVADNPLEEFCVQSLQPLVKLTYKDFDEGDLVEC